MRTVRVPLALEEQSGIVESRDDWDSMFGFWYTDFEFVSGAFLWFFFLCPE